MMTFSSLANITTTSALAGLKAGISSVGQSALSQGTLGQIGLSRSELEANAIGKIAEINIIQPKKTGAGIGLMNQEKKSIGLNLQQYNALGQVGIMNAVKRAGSSSLAGLTGSILQKTI